LTERLSPPVVVTPIYEDNEACQRLFRELAKELSSDCFVVALDDGSVQNPPSPSLLEAAGLSGVVVRLKRNVGHQRAIAIGLNYVAEQMPEATCIVMDSDGEDDPATIRHLIEPLASADIDLVVATRRARTETLSFQVFYAIYKMLFYLLSGRRISFGNFMALKPRAVQRLTAMQELWIHVAAAALISKLRIATCPIDRGPRYAGQSSMSFGGLVLHGFRALMVVAEDVLVRVGIACTLVGGLALFAVVLAFALKFVGFSTPGWFSTALGILVLVLLQTAALTLITLMLTGVVRGNPTPIGYRQFIDKLLPTDDQR
jgi:polyisoprenyl-phosphate glycosyltransferase